MPGMTEMMRVTLQSGPVKRTVTLVAPPFPKRGDVLMVEGEGEWTVLRVRKVKGMIAAQASPARPLDSGRASKV